MKKLFLVLSVLFLTYLSFSQTIPKNKGFVSDYENIFTHQQISNLTQVLDNYEKQTSVEIYVLTVADFESDIADFAQDVATEWAVGKKGVDNGLLIVISKNKQIIRTQTGYGLEGYLPDGWLNHTGDSIGIKYPGQYYEGLMMYISQIKERIGSEYSKDNNNELIKENNSDEESILTWLIENVPWYVWVILIFGWAILFLIWPEGALWILFIIFSGGKSGSSGKGGGSFGGGGSSSKF